MCYVFVVGSGVQEQSIIIIIGREPRFLSVRLYSRQHLSICADRKKDAANNKHPVTEQCICLPPHFRLLRYIRRTNAIVNKTCCPVI